MDIDLPEDADEDETAAIAAAVNAYVSMRIAAAAQERGADDERGWSGRQWTFAGRVERVGRRPARVPNGAPRDAWAASGRLRRMR